VNPDWGFNDRVDDFLPGDNATLAEWVTFAKAEWGADSLVVAHLEGFVAQDGPGWIVYGKPLAFIRHLQDLIWTYEHDQAAWDFYRGQAS